MHETFQQTVWSYYHEHGRKMVWRTNISPYYIFVSEVMLQQTQVNRVILKFDEFTSVFPNFKSLAEANLGQVIKVWLGLGYNRRAKFLHLAAQTVINTYNGELPKDIRSLVSLPGIGPNTARSILAFAYNIPHPFIETNIRSVYIHHFFPDSDQVNDKEILHLVEQTLDYDNPREWYWALMDYGAYIKTAYNPNTKSRHYAKQSPFKGSNRQVRAKILALLSSQQSLTISQIHSHFDPAENRIRSNLISLKKEGLITSKDDQYFVM